MTIKLVITTEQLGINATVVDEGILLIGKNSLALAIA
jgi:hypothetical protein